MEPEDFTTRLQKELNSSPQPCLVPFLKRSLPYLQQSLASQELTIEGVRPPAMSQAGKLPPAVSAALHQQTQQQPILQPPPITSAPAPPPVRMLQTVKPQVQQPPPVSMGRPRIVPTVVSTAAPTPTLPKVPITTSSVPVMPAVTVSSIQPPTSTINRPGINMIYL